MGIAFLVMVDGDPAGEAIKTQVKKVCAVEDQCIISIKDLVTGISSPTIEDLFSSEFRRSRTAQTQGLTQAVRMANDGKLALDNDTLENFERLFDLINRYSQPNQT